MTPLPPRPARHLQVFAVSLLLIVALLVGLLFGVRMEALAPATGVVTARDLHEVRARRAGLVDPGWYDAALRRPAGPPLAARLDHVGDGFTDPSAGPAKVVSQFRLADGGNESVAEPGEFHRLQPGDVLWPGQVVATVTPAGAKDPANGAALRVPGSAERGPAPEA